MVLQRIGIALGDWARPAFQLVPPDGEEATRRHWLRGVHPRMAFKCYEDRGGRGRSTMGRGDSLKDILGAFNETVAELSDPEVANQRTLIVP
jgi:hypothetical protein